MGAPATQGCEIDLRAVTVRPTWGAQEHRRWDRLVEAHHYLAFHGVFGKGLRHVATLGSTWLALIGCQPGAFKLAARDRGIGWSAQQQFRRLHLIANNARFVILTAAPGGELGLAGAGAEPAAAVGGHAGSAWIPGSAGRDLRRPRALCRDLLSRVELALAGPDPWLCP